MNTTKHEKNAVSRWLDLIHGLVPPGDSIELPVLTGSMSPLIMPGYTILIRSCTTSEPRAGDIIVFKEGNSLTTHRLLIRLSFGKSSILYQKGDANQFGKWIRSDRVVGVIDCIRNNTGASIIISNNEAKIKAKKESSRQIARTVWNTILIVPRFIKKCLREKRTNTG